MFVSKRNLLERAFAVDFCGVVVSNELPIAKSRKGDTGKSLAKNKPLRLSNGIFALRILYKSFLRS
jgi:hypothetical protein